MDVAIQSVMLGHRPMGGGGQLTLIGLRLGRSFEKHSPFSKLSGVLGVSTRRRHRRLLSQMRISCRLMVIITFNCFGELLLENNHLSFQMIESCLPQRLISKYLLPVSLRRNDLGFSKVYFVDCVRLTLEFCIVFFADLLGGDSFHVNVLFRKTVRICVVDDYFS